MQGQNVNFSLLKHVQIERFGECWSKPERFSYNKLNQWIRTEIVWISPTSCPQLPQLSCVPALHCSQEDLQDTAQLDNGGTILHPGRCSLMEEVKSHSFWNIIGRKQN